MKEILSQLVAGESLGVEQAVDAFERVLSGRATPAQVGAFLSLIQGRGPTEQEVLGGVRVMREKSTRVQAPAGVTVVDTCGTGGDHAQTFNISTAAAIVTAGAGRDRGVVVAKHGNRSVTGKSGSADVLEALGVKVRVAPATLTACLERAGLCFCFAPAHHPVMKQVAAVRQELGFRTVFNLLGPLTNPAGADRQIIGVFAPELTDLLARVLQQLGSKHAMVVHGRVFDSDKGLDELTTSGVNWVSHLRDGVVRGYEMDPEQLGLSIGHPAALQVDSPQGSAAVIRDVLAGRHGPARDVVCLNAAGALIVAGLAADFAQGLELASGAIDSQAAARVLTRLVEITQTDPG